MSTVYLVHTIDTEGPLAEQPPSLSLPSSDFPHMHVDFDSDDLETVIDAHRKRVLGSWTEIAAMLNVATSPENRMLLPDSDGSGWIFNWFCMDHIGFVDNPRYRSMGIHHVFDFYSGLIESQQSNDSIYWHFHPMSTYREANRCATSYINSPDLYYILGRRLLDRKWFPKANRPGFHDERNDAHWFLEQWVPFDFANLGGGYVNEQMNPDQSNGRIGDWRWAPKDWRTYHPHHDCVQLPGNCRRKIARGLNLLNRHTNLTEEELDSGFKRAAEGDPTLVSLISHDWRDLSVEMDYVRYLVRRVAPRYPNVKFKFSDAVEAFNAVHPAETKPKVELSCRLLFKDGLPHRINIEVINGAIFGPQPFLAVRTRSKRIIHDNLNYWRSLKDFHYIFDDQSILPSDVEAIGIATNDDAGNQSIHVVDIDSCGQDDTQF